MSYIWTISIRNERIRDLQLSYPEPELEEHSCTDFPPPALVSKLSEPPIVAKYAGSLASTAAPMVASQLVSSVVQLCFSLRLTCSQELVVAQSMVSPRGVLHQLHQNATVC